jgi:hypothetical protein
LTATAGEAAFRKVEPAAVADFRLLVEPVRVVEGEAR